MKWSNLFIKSMNYCTLSLFIKFISWLLVAVCSSNFYWEFHQDICLHRPTPNSYHQASIILLVLSIYMYLLYSFCQITFSSSDQGPRYRNHHIQADLHLLACPLLPFFSVCILLSISFYSLNLSKISFFVILAFTFRFRLWVATHALPQLSSAGNLPASPFVFRGKLISSCLLRSITTFVLLVVVFDNQASSSLGRPSLLYTAQATRVPSVSELLSSYLSSAFFLYLVLQGSWWPIRF
jgi:hypothetical protein